jgi:HlyD family secretion protein
MSEFSKPDHATSTPRWERHVRQLKRLPYWCGAGVAAALAALLLSGCEHHSSAATPATAPESTANIPTVTVVHPTRATIIRLIKQPGYIKPYEQTPIYSKIAGYVDEITVDKGSRVRKGDLLLRLWVPEMEKDLAAKNAQVDQSAAEVTQAEEGLNAAQANVNTAEANLIETNAGVKQAEADYHRWTLECERAETLLKEKIYDQQTLTEARNQMQQADAGRSRAQAKKNAADAAVAESRAKRRKAEADVKAVKAKLQVAEAQKDQSAAWLDYRNIRAPFDGIVTLRNVHTGHFLQSASSGSTNKAAEPLLVLMRMDIMRVVVQVPEKDAVLVKDGDLANVSFQALRDHVFPNRKPAAQYDQDFHAFPNKVTLLSWSFDDRARTLSVEIHIPNLTGELRPGMYANVTIRAEVPNALTLPVAAVVESVLDTEARHYCFTVVDNKAIRLPVQVGVTGEKVVQVLQKQVRAGKTLTWEDLTGTESIVASNPASLIDGQAVTVESRPPEQAAQKPSLNSSAAN